MSRPLSFLPALVAVAAALLVGTIPLAGPAQAILPPPQGHEPRVITPPFAARTLQRHPAPKPEQTTPLTVELDSIAPSYLPRSGPLEVTGTVTNDSDETWQAVNMHAFLGGVPITSTSELADAVEAPETAEVGDRIYQDGTFDNVGDLAPGESSTFTITLAHRYITRTTPGVYWFGVHALGQNVDGRDGLADGRARTFLPLPPDGARAETVSIVVPVRHAVHHAPDGHITDVHAWARDLSSGGSLAQLADLGEAAGGRSITWLVDPAVPDAVTRLVEGNPGRNLEDSPDETGTEPPPDQPSASATDGSQPDTGADANAATEPGKEWLARMKDAVAGHHVLALPYGDLDVSAAVDRGPSLLAAAIKRSEGPLDAWGVRTSPGIAPPDGYLDPSAAGLLDTRETVLIGDQMLGGPDAPAAVTVDGVRMLTTSSGAAQGGPAPGDPLSMLAMRQRLLSEAALRMLDPPRRPLVVVLPQDFAPSQPTEFFNGLDVPWLHLAPVDTATQRPGHARTPDQLNYPEDLAAQEVPQVNFSSVDRLDRLGGILQSILTHNDQVSSEVNDQGLTALSYAAREHPDSYRVETDLGADWIDHKLKGVRINAPRGVTLASATGSFATTLVNHLDHAVSVRIQAVTDPDLRIANPGTFDLSAGGRQTVLLQARALTPGVHRVKLRITASDGVPLGATDSLPIRSAQVSNVIWVILGVGLALLFGAVVVRVVRRIRGESRE